MFFSFLKLGFRNLFKKNSLYTFINVLGLAVGLSCIWLVSLFINDEYTFDSHFKKSDRIHRIVLDFNSEGNVTSWAKTSAPIGQHLQGLFPEIEQVTRIRKNPGTDLLSVGEMQFFEDQLFFADSTFFQVFDVAFKMGNPMLALNEINNIVLTEALALKYFNTIDVVGRTIRYDNQKDLRITGIIEAMPANVHFRPQAIVSFSTLQDILGEKRLNHWGQFDHYTYVLLREGSSPDQLEEKFPSLLKEFAPDWVAEKESLFLQPIRTIHLQSNRKDEITPNSNESYSYMLGTIALFILLMACANFINLTTATQLSRIKEIAIQKALGANGNILSIYFFIETGIICLGALVISFIIAQMAIPYFNESIGKELSLLESPWLLGLALAITTGIIILTGLFPAIQSEKLLSTQINKSKSTQRGKFNLRSALVIFQFSISIFLMAATWIVFDQLKFLENTHYGFESEQVIVIPVKDRSQNEKFNTIRHEIEQLPGVTKASFSSSTPGANNSLTYTYTLAGSTLGEQPMATFIVDDNFFQLYQLKLISGRIPDPLSADTLADVILNEAAVNAFQLTDPIGQLVSGKVKGRVVGVVENFNHSSLHEKVQPVIMYAFIPSFRFVSVKLHESSGIAALQKLWPQQYNGYPLEYGFLDEEIKRLYGSELKLTKAYTSFSIIAIIVASVGLMGLTTYILNRKLKEISIRKVFGSTSLQIVAWVYKGYTSFIIISSLIAGIAGYLIMQNWLNGFSYRIDLNAIYFIIPAVFMVLVVLASTGIQSLRASIVNPTENLRED